MSSAQLSALLAATAWPLLADFASSRSIQLYLYVHRVDGLHPGVYRHWPEHGELERVRSGDQRVAAARLSLGQDLAGNATRDHTVGTNFRSSSGRCDIV
jgi:hypothetical protein